MADRTVHARHGDTEIVRYDTGGWWVENSRPGALIPARQLSIAEAAERAVAILHSEHGQVFIGRPGGQMFDRKVLADA